MVYHLLVVLLLLDVCVGSWEDLAIDSSLLIVVGDVGAKKGLEHLILSWLWPQIFLHIYFIILIPLIILIIIVLLIL